MRFWNVYGNHSATTKYIKFVSTVDNKCYHASGHRDWNSNWCDFTAAIYIVIKTLQEITVNYLKQPIGTDKGTHTHTHTNPGPRILYPESLCLYVCYIMKYKLCYSWIANVEITTSSCGANLVQVKRWAIVGSPLVPRLVRKCTDFIFE